MIPFYSNDSNSNKSSTQSSNEIVNSAMPQFANIYSQQPMQSLSDKEHMTYVLGPPSTNANFPQTSSQIYTPIYSNAKIKSDSPISIKIGRIPSILTDDFFTQIVRAFGATAKQTRAHKQAKFGNIEYENEFGALRALRLLKKLSQNENGDKFVLTVDEKVEEMLKSFESKILDGSVAPEIAPLSIKHDFTMCRSLVSKINDKYYKEKASAELSELEKYEQSQNLSENMANIIDKIALVKIWFILSKWKFKHEKEHGMLIQPLSTSVKTDVDDSNNLDKDNNRKSGSSSRRSSHSRHRSSHGRHGNRDRSHRSRRRHRSRSRTRSRSRSPNKRRKREEKGEVDAKVQEKKIENEEVSKEDSTKNKMQDDQNEISNKPFQPFQFSISKTGSEKSKGLLESKSALGFDPLPEPEPEKTVDKDFKIDFIVDFGKTNAETLRNGDVFLNENVLEPSTQNEVTNKEEQNLISENKNSESSSLPEIENGKAADSNDSDNNQNKPMLNKIERKSQSRSRSRSKSTHKSRSNSKENHSGSESSSDDSKARKHHHSRHKSASSSRKHSSKTSKHHRRNHSSSRKRPTYTLKDIIAKVPKNIDSFVKSRLNQSLIDKSNIIETKLRSQIDTKLFEYLGSKEQDIVDFVIQMLSEHRNRIEMLNEIKLILAEEAEDFVTKLQRRLVFEYYCFKYSVEMK